MYACGWDRVYAYAMLYMSHTCSVRVRNSLYDIGILCMMVCVSGFRVAVPVLAFLWGRSLFNEISATTLGRPDCAICKNCAKHGHGVYVALEMGARPFPIHLRGIRVRPTSHWAALTNPASSLPRSLLD